MKRRTIFKLLLFLLAGAIINVAVAWGCAFRWGDPGQNEIVALTNDLKSRFAWLDPKCFHDSFFLSFGEREKTGVRACVGVNSEPRSRASPIFDTHWISLESGWPSFSFRGHRWERKMTDWQWGNTSLHSQCNQGLFELRVGKTITRLPTVVLPTGFAINTIFYAAVLWVLFAVPGAVRRRIGGVRIKRGQCASCGYSLRGNAGGEKCPECGAVV